MMRLFLSRLVSAVSIVALVFQPLAAAAQTITIDGTAPAANRPTLGTSGNGKTTINIVAPTAGVSNNRFTSLSTSAGAIFNNSPTAGTSTTGGAVAANTNLVTSGSAKVILGDVRGTTPSALTGALEVFGGKADVIIANQNGITCAGCSFLNTGRATLSTGLPSVVGSEVMLDTGQGVVTIGRAGVSGADRVQLVGRRVVIDGPVISGSIDVVGGASTYNAANSAATAGTAVGAAGSAYAVDATAFGAMTGGSIRILGNEAGLGVRALGPIRATGTDVAVRAQSGGIELQNVTAARTFSAVTSGALHFRDGAVTAGTAVLSAGTSLTQAPGGLITTTGLADLASGSFTVIAGEVVAGAVDATAVADFVNLGSVITSGDLLIVAGEIHNMRPSDAHLTAYAGPGAFNAANYAALVSVSQTWTNRTTLPGAGGVLAGQNVTLTSTVGAVQNSGVLLAVTDLSVTAKTDFTQRALVGAYAATTDLTGVTSDVTKARITSALGAGAGINYGNTRAPLVSGATVYAGAQTTSMGAMSIAAGNSLFNYGGGFYAQSGLTLKATTYDVLMTQYGRMGVANSNAGSVVAQAGRNVTLTASSLTAPTATLWLSAGGGLSVDQISADYARYVNLRLRDSGAAFSNPFTVDTTGYVELIASGALTNTKTITADGAVTLRSISSGLNQAGVVTAGGSATLLAQGALSSANTQAAGRLSLTSATSWVSNEGYNRSTAADVIISAASSYANNDNLLYGRTGVSVTAGNSITNANGKIWAYGDIALLAGRTGAGEIRSSHTTAAAMSGYVQSYGIGSDVVLDNDRGSIVLTNNGAVASGNLTVDASGEVWVQRSALAGEAVTLSAGTNYFVNEINSSIAARTGAIVFNDTTSFYNRSGSTMSAATDILLTGAALYNHTGTMTAGRDLLANMSWKIENHHSAELQGGRNVRLDTGSGYIWNVLSSVTAGAGLTQDSGTAHQVNDRSILSSTLGTVLRSGTTIENVGSTLTASAFSVVSGSYTVNNPGTKMTALSGGISVLSGAGFYNRDSVLDAVGPISITSAGMENDGSRIESNGAIAFTTGGHWRNVNAYSKASAIIAGGAINVVTSGGGYIWNRSSTVGAGGTMLLDAAANVHNEYATLTAAGAITGLSGGEFRQTGGTLRGTSLALTSDSHLYLLTGAVTAATAGPVTLSAVHDFMLDDSTLTSMAGLTLSKSRNAYFYDSNTTVTGNIAVAATGSIDHQWQSADPSRMAATGNVALTAGGRVYNYASSITAGGTLAAISTGSYVLNDSALMRGVGAVTLDAAGQVILRKTYALMESRVQSTTSNLTLDAATQLAISNSVVSGANWLRLNTGTPMTIDAPSLAAADYLHLGQTVRAGMLWNQFTVNTTGALDFVGRDGVWSFVPLTAGLWARVNSTAGSVLLASVEATAGWVQLNAATGLGASDVKAATTITATNGTGILSFAGNVTAGGAISATSGEDITMGYGGCLVYCFLMGPTTITSAGPVTLSSGRHIDLTGTRLSANGAVLAEAGKAVLGNLTIASAAGDNRAAISTTNLGTVTLTTGNLGNVAIRGATIAGAGDIYVFASGDMDLAAATVPTTTFATTNMTAQSSLAAPRISLTGRSLDSAGVTYATPGRLRLTARSANLTAVQGRITAGELLTQSMGATAKTDISGMAAITVAGVLQVETATTAALAASTISAASYDLDLSPATSLTGAVSVTGSTDLILAPVFDLTLGGNTTKRDISLTSLNGRIVNEGVLTATRNLTVVSTAAVAGTAIGVVNNGRLIANGTVSLTSTRGLDTGFVRGGTITAKSLSGNLIATGALLSNTTLRLEASGNIVTRSALATDITISSTVGGFTVTGWTPTDGANTDTGRDDFAARMSALVGPVGTGEDLVTQADLNTALRNQVGALVHATGDLTINVHTDLALTGGGALSSVGDLSLVIGRDLILSSRFDLPEHKLYRSALMTDGDLNLRVARDLRNTGATISAAGDATLLVGNDVLNQAVETKFVLTTEHDCEGNACGRDGTFFSPAEILAGSGIILSANHDILNRGSVISAAGGVSLHAGNAITNDTMSAVYRIVDIYIKKKFLFITTSVTVEIVNKVELASGTIQTLFGDLHLKTDLGDISNIGGIISAGGNVTVDAGRDLIMNAVSVEAQNVYTKRGFSGFLTYSSNKTYWNNYGTALSQIEGMNVALLANRDISGIGAQMMALEDLTLTAGRNLAFDAQQNQLYLRESGWSFGLTSSNFRITQALLDKGAEGAFQAYLGENPALAAVYELATAKNGWGRVNGSLALLWHGAEVLANANRMFKQLGGQISISSSLAKQFMPAEFNLFGTLLTECAKPGLIKSCGAALGIGFRFEVWKSSQTWTESLVTRMGAGTDITLAAAQDVVLGGGLVASAVEDFSIVAGRDLIVTAVADNIHTRNSSWGINAGLAADGFTIGGHVGGARTNQTIYSNASLTAGETMTVTTGRDVSFLGATVSAKNLYMDVARDLRMASRQNTSDSSSWGFNASITFTGAAPTGFTFGGDYGKGARIYTDTPTWIEATDVVDIYVGRTTYLMGAVLASRATAGNRLRLDTDTFVFDNFRDSDFAFNVGGSVSVGTSFKSLSGSANLTYKNVLGVTYATIRGGTVRVRSNANIDLSKLNTDLATVHSVTKNIYVDLKIPGINLATLRDNLAEAGAFIRAATAEVPDQVRAQGQSAVLIYQRMVANGASVADAIAITKSQQFRDLVKSKTELDKAIARFGSLEAIPEGVRLAILQGEVLLYPGLSGVDTTKILIECGLLAGQRCEIALTNYLAQFANVSAELQSISAANFATFNQLFSSIVSTGWDGYQNQIQLRALEAAFAQLIICEPTPEMSRAQALSAAAARAPDLFYLLLEGQSGSFDIDTVIAAITSFRSNGSAQAFEDTMILAAEAAQASSAADLKRRLEATGRFFVDLTPAGDVIGVVEAVGNGDVVGVLLSGIGLVPIGKLAKLTGRTWDVLRAIIRGPDPAALKALTDQVISRVDQLNNFLPPVPQVVLNRLAGSKFERDVIAAFTVVGATKNGTVLKVTLPSGQVVNTIPDIWQLSVGGLLEVKNVLDLSNSDQLRAQVAYCLQNNLPFNLIVSPRTRTISAPLMRAIDQVNETYALLRNSPTTGGIYVFNPATGDLTSFIRP